MPRLLTSFLYFQKAAATFTDNSFIDSLEIRKIKLCHKISG